MCTQKDKRKHKKIAFLAVFWSFLVVLDRFWPVFGRFRPFLAVSTISDRFRLQQMKSLPNGKNIGKKKTKKNHIIGLFLAVFGSFGRFRPFLAVFGCFWSFLANYKLQNLGSVSGPLLAWPNTMAAFNCARLRQKQFSFMPLFGYFGISLVVLVLQIVRENLVQSPCMAHYYSILVMCKSRTKTMCCWSFLAILCTFWAVFIFHIVREHVLHPPCMAHYYGTINVFLANPDTFFLLVTITLVTIVFHHGTSHYGISLWHFFTIVFHHCISHHCI